MTKETMGVYIHIPFCQKQCHYCDFLTFVNRDDTIGTYIDHLIQEIYLYQDNDYLLDTIYFGGGTPSYIEAVYITQVMDALKDVFAVADDCEVTIEMNPESVTEEKIQSYLDTGINRFSMGVQSFNDDVLRMMGRVHRRETVYKNIALMEALGCQKIGIDLMFGNPKQDFDVLIQDIEEAVALPINHISYYSLMIKENTAFARWVETGQIHLIDDDAERQMYHLIQRRLKEAGFHQYEISNFARGDVESRHNKKYWTLQNYIGLGLGASGNIDLVRYQNAGQFEMYFDAIRRGERPVVYEERLNREQREKEYIILHMRLLQGVNIEAVNQRFGIDFLKKYESVIAKHLKYKTIRLDGDHLSFTDYGLDVGNQFYLDIL